MALWAVGFLAVLVAIAAILDKVWDAPIRKVLRARFMGEKRTPERGGGGGARAAAKPGRRDGFRPKHWSVLQKY